MRVLCPCLQVCNLLNLRIHRYHLNTMTTKTQLQNKIQELETELQEFKSQLSSYQEITIENASVGDTLEDGSIVLQKENGLALLLAPKSTEVECPWSKDFPKVFQKLEEQGFNPSQWFVPTKEQLHLAYQNIPNEFSTTIYWYWSSTELNATDAYIVGHTTGSVGNIDKSRTFRVRAFSTFRVRAFRCVTY